MATDRESDRRLLELAAKAAGLRIDKSKYNGGGSNNTGFDMDGNAMLDWHNNVIWNPLTRGGDARSTAHGSASGLVSRADFKSVGGTRERAAVGSIPTRFRQAVRP